MSTRTTNFNLIKPELSDPANITAMNENWDKIDQLLNNKPTGYYSGNSSSDERIIDLGTDMANAVLITSTPGFYSVLVMNRLSIYVTSESSIGPKMGYLLSGECEIVDHSKLRIRTDNQIINEKSIRYYYYVL